MESPAFVAVAPHYDVLMRDIPYGAWVRYMEQLLELRGSKPRRALDLACGTGNVTEILADSGFEVVGVDISEPMIAEARKKAASSGRRIDYHVQDAAELDLPGSPFDLCVSFFDSLNYIIEPEKLDRAIQRVAAHVRPGGLFIFDINSAFALENGFFDQENLDTRRRLRYVWRSEYDPESRLCRIHMRFFLRGNDDVDHEFREEHIQFAYTEDDIREMLSSAGFDEIETFHAYTLYPVRPTSDRVFFVARYPTP